jgi:hypothetical protein
MDPDENNPRNPDQTSDLELILRRYGKSMLIFIAGFLTAVAALSLFNWIEDVNKRLTRLDVLEQLIQEKNIEAPPNH